MTWNDIIGQQRVQRLLHHAIADNRLPQALILSGMEGVGKMAIALAFATLSRRESVRVTVIGSAVAISLAVAWSRVWLGGRLRNGNRLGPCRLLDGSWRVLGHVDCKVGG